MENSRYLLTPGGSLILPTPIASAENTGQNEWSAESQDKTSEKEPTAIKKVVAPTDFDTSIAQSNAD